MSYRRPFKAARVAGKRAEKFSSRLATLRKFSTEFDSTNYEALWNSRPRSEAGKKRKKAALEKVRRAFERLRPFLHRPHKLVRPRSARNLKTLAKFAGMSNFKKLRAVPVMTDRAKTLRVSFDRRGRVQLRDGHAKHKAFLFPHKPRNHYKGGKLIKSLADDVLEMTAAMIPKMPRGMFVIMTRHNFLIPTVSDRDQLLETLRRMLFQYKGSPEFLSLLYGFKWISGSYERAAEFQKYMHTERGRLKLERKRQKAEAAARIIAAMDRQLKSGKLPKLSKRARATGRR